jgi:hypothetical protein
MRGIFCHDDFKLSIAASFINNVNEIRQKGLAFLLFLFSKIFSANSSVMLIMGGAVLA